MSTIFFGLQKKIKLLFFVGINRQTTKMTMFRLALPCF